MESVKDIFCQMISCIINPAYDACMRCMVLYFVEDTGVSGVVSIIENRCVSLATSECLETISWRMCDVPGAGMASSQ